MVPRQLRNNAAALIFALAGLGFSPTALATVNPFAGHATPSHDLSPFTKWTGVLARYEQQKDTAEAQCADDNCNVRKWERLLSSLRGKPVREQVEAVNTFFNAMPYVEDSANWGVEDYWETPYEIMTRGGDCEDYAIAKYISLKRLGVAETAMRIMVVHDSDLNGEMHAILEVKVGGKPLILDNQASSVAEEGHIFHYHPIYAINEVAWWAY